MKNVCIVGYGAIGPIHAKAISKTENARFYAVCDIDPQKLDKCREQYDVLTYSNYEKMLCNEDIHSVHICTPHHLHFEMIIKALEAGKKVVCEKPVTMTEKEFAALLTHKNSSNVCVVLQNRLNPCIVKLKEIIQSQMLGSVKAVKGILTWQRTSEYYNKDAWRGKWATEGGGVLINQAIHTLDYFCYTIGEVTEVTAQMTNFSIDEIEVEDTLTAFLKFKSGVKGVFFATNAYGVNSAPEFEVVFERGKVRYIDGKLLLDGKIVEEDIKPVLGKTYWGNGHEKLFRNYYDQEKYFTPFDIKNTMDVVYSMYENALGKEREHCFKVGTIIGDHHKI